MLRVLRLTVLDLVALELLELGVLTRDTFADRSGDLVVRRSIAVFLDLLSVVRLFRDTADGLVVRVALRRTVAWVFPELLLFVSR